MKPARWAAFCLIGGVVAALLLQQTLFSPDTGGSLSIDTADKNPAAAESQIGNTPASSDTSASREKTDVDRSLTAIDRSLPDFSLPGLDESIWTAETLKGKSWVINFWASWCSPCIEEIPSMNAAYEILKPQGVGMLAINAGEGVDTVEEFLEKIAIEFPNVLGDTGTLQNWSVRGLPTTIIVNAEGAVIYEALGPREWDDEQLLQRVVDSL